jgi:hypothetical protein
MYRRSNGTQTTKRGFTSERAARDARRRLVEQVEMAKLIYAAIASLRPPSHQKTLPLSGLLQI